MFTYIALLGIGACIALDQALKALAVHFLADVDTVPLIQNILHFTYVENYGAAFGIFQNKTFFLVVITGVIILGILALIVAKKIKPPLLLVSLSLVVAGGLGNLIDRVTRGYVVDYIDFRLIHFPVFNFADCCVVIGTCLFVLYVFLSEVKAAKDKGAEDSGGGQ